MPLDPEIRQLLDAVAALDLPSITEQTPAAARAAFSRMTALAPRSTAALQAVVDRTCPGPGGSIALRVYTPEGRGPHPALIYLHGGGFVVGDLDSHDTLCRELCAGGRCTVVAVDYRLAPEHRFPAGVEDSAAATHWVMQHASALGIDATRIAIGGDSAGANLATVVARRRRDAGNTAPCAQLLVYPVTGHYSHATPSLRDNAIGYGLTRAAMMWYADHYLAATTDVDHPDVSPLRAESLAGLPPAYVATCEYDPLRDEGEAYGQRLAAAGVTTTLKRYAGLIHGVFKSPTALNAGRRMVDDACAWLRWRFDP